MYFLSFLLGVAFVVTALIEAFETVILPRSVRRPVRLTSLFFELSSRVYQSIGRMRPGPRRQSLLNSFAPLLLLLLIVVWAALLVSGFALIHWGLHTRFSDPEMGGHFIRHLYFSGVTFFTLGYGDVVPKDDLGRAVSILEAGLGFGFLAVVIGYVPVFYNSFSRREVGILMLDTRAGSDPTGFELIRRHAEGRVLAQLPEFLHDWEKFAAELLEGFLSYPLLAYYRSQHDDQSWLRSLVAVMDACALIESGIEDHEECRSALKFQARATFAMGRHVLVDLAYVLDIAPRDGTLTRLTPEQLAAIRARLSAAGVCLTQTAVADQHLDDVRRMYEPYAQGLAQELLLELPTWVHAGEDVEHWQTSAWEGVTHF